MNYYKDSWCFLVEYIYLLFWRNEFYGYSLFFLYINYFLFFDICNIVCIDLEWKCYMIFGFCIVCRELLMNFKKMNIRGFM